MSRRTPERTATVARLASIWQRQGRGHRKTGWGLFVFLTQQRPRRLLWELQAFRLVPPTRWDVHRCCRARGIGPR